ncbi:MAG: NAD(P)H-binding protein, partial [Pseudonocardia sp.]|nr:NAD(P)H-binding protein [Pseudonocardia sp.]
MSGRTALVVGATGLTGRNAAEHLAASGWEVYGMARHPAAVADGVHPVAGDALDPASVKAVAERVRPTHLFYCTWLRRDTEELNIEVNGAMLRHTLDAAGAVGTVEHVALVTGLKYYLGPFEAYGRNPARPP